jgi:hypothetical protein
MSAKFCKIRFFIFACFLFTTTVVPFLSASLDLSSQITDGEELIKAMYEKYKGKWYDKLKIKRRGAREPDLERIPGASRQSAQQHRTSGKRKC